MNFFDYTLETGFLRRRFAPGTLELWTRGSTNMNWMPHHHKTCWGTPFEGAVKIGGEWWELVLGKRGNHLWPEPDKTIEFTGHALGEDHHEKQLELKGMGDGFEITIRYATSCKLPYLSKQLIVRNTGTEPIIIDNLAPEIIYRVRLNRNLHMLSDYPQDVMREDDIYAGYVRCCFPDDIGHELLPGESVSSFRLIEFFSGDDRHDTAIWRSRVLRHFAPWAVAGNKVKFQFSGFSVPAGQNPVAALKAEIDKCAEAGIEQLSFFVDQIWTNIGDYQLRPELFPNGKKDLIEILSYIKSRNMEAGVYCSYAIAHEGTNARELHRDWECRNLDGNTFDPPTFGNMCVLSKWGEYILAVFDYLTLDLGFNYLDFDGPTDIPCHADGHDHKSLGEYRYRTWRWEYQLFNTLKSRNVSFTIPRDESYILMGAAKICGGYSEEDFCHSSGEALVTNYRSGMAFSRPVRPAWMCWGFLSLDQYHGNGVNYSADNLFPLEYGLAGLLGYGNGGFITGCECGNCPEAVQVLRRWSDIFKQYRELFSGESLILANPDGQNPDGIAFYHGSQILAVIFNSDTRKHSRTFSIPAKYRGNQFDSTEILLQTELEPKTIQLLLLPDKGPWQSVASPVLETERI